MLCVILLKKEEVSKTSGTFVLLLAVQGSGYPYYPGSGNINHLHLRVIALSTVFVRRVSRFNQIRSDQIK